MPTIHNHTVEGDADGLHALRQLDSSEAQVLFEHAKRHGEADFEASIHNKRLNMKLVREADGSWKVESEGRDSSTGSGSGWF